MTYTRDGQLATLTAVNAVTGDQTTRYVYGSTLASYVARSDLLVAEIYPDSDDSPFDDGDDAVPDRIEYTYNRQGQRKSRRDQNGTLRGFLFDKLGRLVHDYVEVLAPGVDGRVRRITREYGCANRLKTISAYTHPCARTGAVASQVAFGYNEHGLLSAEYQSHDGPVNMAATPCVQYGYDATFESGELVKGLRPTRVVYPSGRVVRYEYGNPTSSSSSSSSSSGPTTPDPDDCLNRVKFIADDDAGQVGTHLAEYQYLGLGAIVTEDYPEPRVKLDYTPDGYSGFDRFGRVIDHCWRNYATGQDLVRYQYAHDRAGNRTSRRNATTTERDEHYLYDGLYRLIRADRGNLDPAMHRIAGTPERQESWTLEATGNWSRHTERESGRLTHDQSRTHNRANELLSFSVATGDPWSNPSHDRNGNMTRIPKPANPRESMSLRWDAWDRLVRVTDTAGPIVEYQYDPRGFRIAAHTYRDPASPDAVLASPLSRFFYHNARWQVLEERTGDSGSDLSALPSLHYIYSLRYIDAPILRDRRLPGELSPLSERLYYLGDANFNVTSLISPAGSPVERYAYTPYGNVTILAPDWHSTRASSAFDNAILYTGREWDFATDLYYFRARHYWSGSAQFIRRDPQETDSNAYSYVRSSPVSATDPLGLSDAFPVPIELVHFGQRTVKPWFTEPRSLIPFYNPDKTWLAEAIWQARATGPTGKYSVAAVPNANGTYVAYNTRTLYVASAAGWDKVWIERIPSQQAFPAKDAVHLPAPRTIAWNDARFARGSTPQTWGEAMAFRAARQGSSFPLEGSLQMPKVKPYDPNLWYSDAYFGGPEPPRAPARLTQGEGCLVGVWAIVTHGMHYFGPMDIAPDGGSRGAGTALANPMEWALQPSLPYTAPILRGMNSYTQQEFRRQRQWIALYEWASKNNSQDLASALRTKARGYMQSQLTFELLRGNESVHRKLSTDPPRPIETIYHDVFGRQ